MEGSLLFRDPIGRSMLKAVLCCGGEVEGNWSLSETIPSAKILRDGVTFAIQRSIQVESVKNSSK